MTAGCRGEAVVAAVKEAGVDEGAKGRCIEAVDPVRTGSTGEVIAIEASREAQSLALPHTRPHMLVMCTHVCWLTNHVRPQFAFTCHGAMAPGPQFACTWYLYLPWLGPYTDSSMAKPEPTVPLQQNKKTPAVMELTCWDCGR